MAVGETVLRDVHGTDGHSLFLHVKPNLIDEGWFLRRGFGAHDQVVRGGPTAIGRFDRLGGGSEE